VTNLNLIHVRWPGIYLKFRGLSQTYDKNALSKIQQNQQSSRFSQAMVRTTSGEIYNNGGEINTTIKQFK